MLDEDIQGSITRDRFSMNNTGVFTTNSFMQDTAQDFNKPMNSSKMKMTFMKATGFTASDQEQEVAP